MNNNHLIRYHGYLKGKLDYEATGIIFVEFKGIDPNHIHYEDLPTGNSAEESVTWKAEIGNDPHGVIDAHLAKSYPKHRFYYDPREL